MAVIKRYTSEHHKGVSESLQAQYDAEMGVKRKMPALSGAAKRKAATKAAKEAE